MVAALELELQHDPHSAGESREAGYRVVFADPVAMRMFVDDGDIVVVVTKFWIP